MTHTFTLTGFPQIQPDFDNLDRWLGEFLDELRLMSAALACGFIPFIACF